MNKTTIEWTDKTVNPFVVHDPATGETRGHHCHKISPGCKNCYASRMQPRFGLEPFHKPGRLEGLELRLAENRLRKILRIRQPAKIFWCDMTDMFLDEHPDAWIDACFAVMALTPHLTHQVLTKRPKRLREWFTTPGRNLEVLAHVNARYTDHSFNEVPWPLPNVWLGVSAEDQTTADERIPDLLATPAAVRFVSAEPLLGPIDLERWLDPTGMESCPQCGDDDQAYLSERDMETLEFTNGGDPRCPECGFPRVLYGYDPRLDWVITGGESGPGARATTTADSVRSLRDQCAAAGVPFFFKQWGEFLPDSQHPAMTAEARQAATTGAIRVGKHKAGRLLDGVEHSAFPTQGAQQ